MKLNEVMVATNPRLTSDQEQALFQLFMSQGSGDVLKGNNHLMAAAEFLAQSGMIVPRNGNFEVTPSGMQVLVAQGLIDQLTKQPTELAQKYNAQ